MSGMAWHEWISAPPLAAATLVATARAGPAAEEDACPQTSANVFGHQCRSKLEEYVIHLGVEQANTARGAELQVQTAQTAQRRGGREGCHGRTQAAPKY